jgi:hypothetical protein
MSDVVGRALAGPIRSGEPITDVRLDGDRLAAGTAGTPLAPPGDGLVAMPVRFADVQAAALLRAGEHVDVLAATPPARVSAATPSSGSSAAPTMAAVVASDVAVISAPVVQAGGEAALDPVTSAGLATSDGALVVLATTREQARALAEAELTARLSAVVVQ